MLSGCTLICGTCLFFCAVKKLTFWPSSLTNIYPGLFFLRGVHNLIIHSREPYKLALPSLRGITASLTPRDVPVNHLVPDCHILPSTRNCPLLQTRKGNPPGLPSSGGRLREATRSRARPKIYRGFSRFIFYWVPITSIFLNLILWAHQVVGQWLLLFLVLGYMSLTRSTPTG